MTEEQWLACEDPKLMLEFLSFDRAQDRKKRLFAFACCRSIWQFIPEGTHREAIVVAEKHIDGETTDTDLGTAIASVHRLRRKRDEIDWAVYNAVRYPRGVAYHYADSVCRDVACVVASVAGPNPSPTARSYFQGEVLVRETIPPNPDRLVWDAAFANQMRLGANLLRCIFGNPFRPVTFNPAWGTSDVMVLAQGIYDDRDFDRMPILADALQDAGCDNDDILNHCRDTSTPHARGCWVVDLVLGKV